MIAMNSGDGAAPSRRCGLGGRSLPPPLPSAALGIQLRTDPRGVRESWGAGRAEDEDEDDVGDDLESHGEKKEELGSYSRRKIVSNWNRYEDAEKEAQNESGESQRGSDFSVLLSSAGDSFSQFRFAEEKEWDTENVCPKQLSALYVDCQSLVQALQELPLHLRLNVAAELVQASTPVELPQMKPKSTEIGKSSVTHLRQPLAQSRIMPVSDPISDSVTCSQSRDGLGGTPFPPIQRGSSVPKQETDHLDEELDLLLNLDAPVNSENSSVSGALSYDVTDEADLKTSHKAPVPLKLDATEEKSPAPENTSKTITEEELEDWLDSMIS
ncbi:PREDICTED: cell death regulator Aven [Crocodylus porosus]|uniref:cell death regulator Aven n=1 Tax=Crocodylus porosus TaxID=8502 RepID=UPI00093E8E68|nr:PREDICTED: cell death regulator Aven [Crocodylus porosus]